MAPIWRRGGYLSEVRAWLALTRDVCERRSTLDERLIQIGDNVAHILDAD